MRDPLEPGASPIEHLDPTGYYGHEMETMQKQDRTQRWFIKQLKRQPRPDIEVNIHWRDSEAEVMVNDMANFRIHAGGPDQGYKLLVYLPPYVQKHEDPRISDPRENML